MITYGLIFAAQQSMNFAAESGARAGLQWQAGATSLTTRAQKAMSVAAEQADWVDQLAGGSKLKIAVCSGNPNAPLAAQNLAAGESLCQLTDTGKLEIVIRYPYASAPLVPYLGPSTLLQAAVPETLESRSSVDLGIALDHSS